MTNAALLPKPLPLSCPAGLATVSLYVVRPGVFRVETVHTSTRAVIDAWSCSYPDEHTARVEARRAALAFMHHRTADRLEAEYHRLTVAIGNAEDRHRPTGRLQSEREAVQPLRGRAADEDLAARILGTIRQAAVINTLPEAERRDEWEAARDSFEASRLPVQPVGLPRRNSIQPSI